MCSFAESHKCEPSVLDEVLTDEYSEKNLRAVVRQALQAIAAEERPTTVQKLSEKSFDAIMQATAKPIGVQLFYTRLHVVYLEELLALDTVSQFASPFGRAI